MIRPLFLAALLCLSQTVFALSDSTATHAAVLVIPYNPSMHLSDCDPEIAMNTGVDVGEMRKSLRSEILRCLNKSFAEIHDVKMPDRSFVNDANNEMEVIYHSIFYTQKNGQTSGSLLKSGPADSAFYISKTAKKIPHDKVFMNSEIRDQLLLKDLSEKYGANYFIFLNEMDINSRPDDYITENKQSFIRDIKLHFSIYTVSGKQIGGDVAEVHISSDMNTVKMIVNPVFPVLSKYILDSFNRSIR